MSRRVLTVFLTMCAAFGTIARASAQATAETQRPPGEQTPQTPAPVVSAEQPPPVPEPSVPVHGMTATWQDGLTIESADGEYQVRIGAFIRFDGRMATDPPPGALTDTFTMRILRATIQGRITRYFTFRVVPDFTSTVSNVADAYAELALSDLAHVRVGRDKTPLGFETLLPDPYVLFMERGMTLNLMPGRDVGVQLFGDLPGGAVSYVAGIFNGIVDGGTAGNLDTDNGKELVGRVVVRPFVSGRVPALRRLGVAVAGSREQQLGAVPIFRTSIQQPYFFYAAGTSADGLHTRVSAQLFHYYRSASTYTEYVRSEQWVRKADARTLAANQAWQVVGSYLVTGETAGDRVHPKRPFDPGARTWGALQLMARYGSMTLDPAVFALGMADSQASREVQAATVGAIWYMTTNVKSLFNVERTVFDRDPRGARPAEHGVLFRLQLNF